MNSKIQAARKHISDYELQLETARQEVKDCRAALKAAIRELYRAIDNDANGVQDLPFGGDGEPGADHEEDELERHMEVMAGPPVLWPGDNSKIVEETHSTLMSLGHSGFESRRLMNSSWGSGPFLSSRDWIEAIYNRGLVDHPDITDELMAAAEEFGEGLEHVPPNGWDTDTTQPVAELEALADEGLIERKATVRRSNRKGKA